MVIILETILKFTPAGNPDTIAPVAPSNNWYSIGAIGVSSHSICESVPVGEVNTNPPSASTVMVPLKLVSAQVPIVVIVYGYTVWVLIFTEGVPEMVTKSLIIEKVTPNGNPVIFAPVAPALNW